MTSIAAYGTWESPISAADVARGAVAVSYPSIAGGEVWWMERRPSEGGRSTIVACASPGAAPRELLPAPWNARTRVHEYGGKSYLPVPSLSLAGGFDLVFANFADQRLYAAGGAVDAGISPVPLTPSDLGFRFADMVLSPDGEEIWCVREISLPAPPAGEALPDGFHLGGGMAVRRDIVAVPLDGSAATDPAAIRVLVSGAQFFAFPTPSPDGTRLAWISWNHPNMPWDGTELRVCAVTGDTVQVADATLVMGGAAESVLAPVWRDDAALYAISDASGWWNLYEVPAEGGSPRALHPLAEEFAGPMWQLGGRPFDVLGDGRLVVLHGLGEHRLGLLDPDSGALTDLDLPGYRNADAEIAVAGTTIAAIAGGPRTPWSVLRITADDGFEVMKSQPIAAPDPAYLPDARPVRLPAGPNGEVVHALVYAPSHPLLTGPAGELPPYIVHVHGGPTSNSVPVVSMEKAYFTSRGIGVIDINYGGSTGYGREYRNRLRGQWGIVDVADAYTAALGLASAGEADRDRLGIRGGSAGGWTALAAVTSGPYLTGTKEAVFAAVTSYYGVADLRPFATDTHDFESRYMDGLIGPLPEADQLYVERAPVGHVNELTCPILLLQGLDDPVVPPAQSEAMAADLAAHGIRHAYIAFEAESHGFRKTETLIESLEAELAFYGEIFGFTPPGVPPVELS
ncbi:S9 family peptidase [Trebonia kvetii]|uniref:S9 family peptidase n=1 Tax=Trebonia kvetii TaxID=2480626 RepID=A0A6P2C3X0_9ACTN|nr:prolyl oligopeptidase family serine peptidase [Trebonia kvetii]TVZ06084.1 S9 family peptidase [Trebonia kvetii]